MKVPLTRSAQHSKDRGVSDSLRTSLRPTIKPLIDLKAISLHSYIVLHHLYNSSKFHQEHLLHGHFPTSAHLPPIQLRQGWEVTVAPARGEQ